MTTALAQIRITEDQLEALPSIRKQFINGEWYLRFIDLIDHCYRLEKIQVIECIDGSPIEHEFDGEDGKHWAFTADGRHYYLHQEYDTNSSEWVFSRYLEGRL